MTTVTLCSRLFAMKEKPVLVHVRFAPDLVKLLDARVEEMQREARKISPTIEFSRGDAVQAIVTQALKVKR